MTRIGNQKLNWLTRGLKRLGEIVGESSSKEEKEAMKELAEELKSDASELLDKTRKLRNNRYFNVDPNNDLKKHFEPILEKTIALGKAIKKLYDNPVWHSLTPKKLAKSDLGGDEVERMVERDNKIHESFTELLAEAEDFLQKAEDLITFLEENKTKNKVENTLEERNERPLGIREGELISKEWESEFEGVEEAVQGITAYGANLFQLAKNLENCEEEAEEEVSNIREKVKKKSKEIVDQSNQEVFKDGHNQDGKNLIYANAVRRSNKYETLKDIREDKEDGEEKSPIIYYFSSDKDWDNHIDIDILLYLPFLNQNDFKVNGEDLYFEHSPFLNAHADDTTPIRHYNLNHGKTNIHLLPPEQATNFIEQLEETKQKSSRNFDRKIPNPNA